jgi:hypothetical protein
MRAVRLTTLLAILVLTLLAGVLPGDATASTVAARKLLAPPGECPGAEDPKAHHRLQRLAMHCLVRFARQVAVRPDVASSVVLRHSATLKARRIAECRTFTHNPCGDALGAQLRDVELNRSRWLLGENLTWGARGRRITARAAVLRWLDSPKHRRILLDDRFTHMGVRRRRLALKGAPRGAVLWVLHLGTPLP